MLIKTPAIHLSQAEKNPVFLTSSTYRALIKINLFWDILVLIPKLIMRLGQCSGKGLTFEKSAIETLYGGQFQSSTQFTKSNHLVIPTTNIVPQFLWKLLLFIHWNMLSVADHWWSFNPTVQLSVFVLLSILFCNWYIFQKNIHSHFISLCKFHLFSCYVIQYQIK